MGSGYSRANRANGSTLAAASVQSCAIEEIPRAGCPRESSRVTLRTCRTSQKRDICASFAISCAGRPLMIAFSRSSLTCILASESPIVLVRRAPTYKRGIQRPFPFVLPHGCDGQRDVNIGVEAASWLADGAEICVELRKGTIKVILGA